MDMHTVFTDIDSMIETFDIEMKKIYASAKGVMGTSDRFYDYLKCEGAIAALRALKETLEQREAIYLEEMADHYDKEHTDG